MAKLYQNKYRIPSARATWWDYNRNGVYFITICTHNRQHFFGNIVNGRMQLSAVGWLVNQHWHEITERFPYARLDAWVVMPNHVHGILIIDKPDGGDGGDETGQSVGGITGHHNPMLHDNLARVIRWYKGRTTFESRKIQFKFAWQTRFYDNIVRNRTSLDNIRRYIHNNPTNWIDDRFYI